MRTYDFGILKEIVMFKMNLSLVNRICILFLIVGGVFLNGCNLVKSNPNMNLGMDAIEAGNYSEALTCFAKGIDKDENLVLCYRGQGIAHMGMLDYESAIKSFEKALMLGNGFVKKVDIDISYYLAMAEYKAGNIDKAIETYSAIIGIKDKAEDAYMLRARAELRNNDKETALLDFDKVVEFRKNDYDVYFEVYEALNEMGYNADAVSYIEKAMNLNEKKTDYQYGMLSYYLDNYDEAKTYLERARENNDSESLVLYLGRCYEMLGDLNYATSLYTTYLDQKPGDAAIYNELGLMRIKLGDYQGALSAFDSGLTLADPEYAQRLMYNEIVTYEYLNEYKKAAVAMQEYLKTYPEDQNAVRECVFLSSR